MDKHEEQELVRLLQKVEAGFVPFEIFLELMRLVTSSAVELLVFRKKNEQLEVLLVPRDKKYPHEYWDNNVHIPGVVIRPGDTDDGSPDIPIRRIIEDELSGLKMTKPRRVTTQYRRSYRGSECSQVFVAMTDAEPLEGAFYSPEDLPENLVEEHARLIQTVVGILEAE